MDVPRETPATNVTRARAGVVLLLAIYVVAFVDRQVLALLVTPIRRDLGIDDTRMALLLGFAFVTFYTLLGLPLSTLADRWSRRGTIGLGLVAWSAMTIACGASQTYAQLFLARMGVGLGEAALSPAAYSWIAASFPPHARSRAIGAYSMGIYLGSGLAFVAGGAVVELAQAASVAHGPFAGWKPWQATLVITGSAGVLLAPLVLTLREPVRASAHAAAATWSDLVRWLRAHARVIGWHHLGFALLSWSGYAVNLWIPSVLERAHGWTRTQAGVGYGIVLGVCGALGVYLGGALADRRRARDPAPAAVHAHVGFLAAACAAPCAALLAFAPSGGVLLALLAPLSFATAAGFGVAAAGVQELAPPMLRARASAVYLLAINLVGGGLGPLSVSLLSDHVLANGARTVAAAHSLADGQSLSRALAIVAAVTCIGAAFALHACARAARAATR